MVEEHLGSRPYHLRLSHQPQPSQNLHQPLVVGPLLGPLSYIFIFCVSPQLLHRDAWAPFQGSPNDIKSYLPWVQHTEDELGLVQHQHYPAMACPY